MNPELQRNLWLEAPPRRVLWIGLVLCLLFGVVLSNADTARERTTAMSITGGIVFLVGAIWAMRAATRSILSEIAERTWDFQRTSAVSPWDMTTGKLLGAAAPALGTAAIGLVVAAMTADEVSTALQAVVDGVGVLTLVTALGLSAALIGVRKARPEGRSATLRAVFGGVAVGAVLLSVLVGGFGRLPGAGLGAGLGGGLTEERTAAVLWWGAPIARDVFFMVSIWAFAAFAVAGAWRLMRLELQLRNAPIVWPAFVVFACVYACGLAPGGSEGNTATVITGVAALTSAALAYAAAFAEPADPVALRRFGAAMGRNLTEAAQVAPAALWPLAVAVAAILMTTAMGAAPVLGMALIAFMVRDLAVIAVFRLGPRPRRGDAGAIVALALLYGVGAMIAAPLFVPTEEAGSVSLISALVQAVVLWAIAIRRIRRPEA